jgi:hypothetical protein
MGEVERAPHQHGEGSREMVVAGGEGRVDEGEERWGRRTRVVEEGGGEGGEG